MYDIAAKYPGGNNITDLRKLEKASIKARKAELDLNFLRLVLHYKFKFNFKLLLLSTEDGRCTTETCQMCRYSYKNCCQSASF